MADKSQIIKLQLHLDGAYLHEGRPLFTHFLEQARAAGFSSARLALEAKPDGYDEESAKQKVVVEIVDDLEALKQFLDQVEKLLNLRECVIQFLPIHTPDA